VLSSSTWRGSANGSRPAPRQRPATPADLGAALAGKVIRRPPLRYGASVTDSLEALACEVVECRRCPRLVSWREQVARERRAAYREQAYWGRPVTGFGDPKARVVLLGLAPAAHGGNRTGRIFTGDRSGDFLFAALWRTGFANVPTSVSRDDGLRLRDAWVTAAVRCAPPANKPSPQERDQCLRWSLRELRLLQSAKVMLCLGAFAWDAALRLRAQLESEAQKSPEGSSSAPEGSPAIGSSAALAPRGRPRFAHGARSGGARLALLGCYHPSQQNTFTGRLTERMLDEVLDQARQIAGLPQVAAAKA
jgi:uracil-DNA glycosylase